MSKTVAHRLYSLISVESLRGQRFVLALLSLAWGCYLFSPFVHMNFLNMAGGALFMCLVLTIFVNLIFGEENLIPISEGVFGVVLWCLVVIDHVMGQPTPDDTVYLQAIPLILSWWIFANGLARLKVN